jgi:hypothetical protein
MKYLQDNNNSLEWFASKYTGTVGLLNPLVREKLWIQIKQTIVQIPNAGIQK